MAFRRQKIWRVVILLCGVILVYSYLLTSIEKTEEYRKAVLFLSSNNKVSEKLGIPMRYSVNILTKVYIEQLADSEKKSELKINIVGEKDKGRADIELETSKGEWMITKATLFMKTAEKIDLMEH
jgi:hypothetical protein